MEDLFNERKRIESSAYMKELNVRLFVNTDLSSLEAVLKENIRRRLVHLNEPFLLNERYKLNIAYPYLQHDYFVNEGVPLQFIITIIIASITH